MPQLFWLSDESWSIIEPLLPNNQPGARRVDDRRVISGFAPPYRFAPGSAEIA
jgi:transposase